MHLLTCRFQFGAVLPPCELDSFRVRRPRDARTLGAIQTSNGTTAAAASAAADSVGTAARPTTVARRGAGHSTIWREVRVVPPVPQIRLVLREALSLAQVLHERQFADPIRAILLRPIHTALGEADVGERGAAHRALVLPPIVPRLVRLPRALVEIHPALDGALQLVEAGVSHATVSHAGHVVVHRLRAVELPQTQRARETGALVARPWRSIRAVGDAIEATAAAIPAATAATTATTAAAAAATVAAAAAATATVAIAAAAAAAAAATAAATATATAATVTAALAGPARVALLLLAAVPAVAAPRRAGAACARITGTRVG
jgi:hypothetical protein